MLIDADLLIARQLAATEPSTLTFADGRETAIQPSHQLPQPVAPECTVDLAGDWSVATWPFRDAETTLVAHRLDDEDWPVVALPGKVFSWDPEVQPASVPNWNRVGLTHLNPDDGAILRRRVFLPRGWKGQRIILRFDSIYPAGRVYLDGHLLGTHTSGLTPVEYDVTSLVKAGRSVVVAVRLLRTHPHVKLDMPRHAGEYAGLAQSACFFALAPCHFYEDHLDARLDATLTEGTVAGQVTVRQAGEHAASGKVTLTLTDAHGQRVARRASRFAVGAGATVAVPLSVSVAQPALWNDERPHLYTVTLELEVAGQDVQTLSYRTGFRRFDLSTQRPLLNGHPVKFRGVNHLTFHPEHGLYTPPDWLRECLLLMKAANINCIRTHYLGPRYLADLCDELGLYLLQELPIDWGTNYIHDVAWVGPAMQRLAGGVLRDRRHPSLMVWSVGNENMPESAAVADDGHHHLAIYDRFVKQLDPTRPTMFPPPGPANKIRGIFECRVGDIGDTHYSFNLVKDFLQTGVVTNPRSWTSEMETTTREAAIARGWSGVWFSSEYGIADLRPDLHHAPYGSIIDDVKEPQYSGKTSLQTFIDRLRREWGFMRGEPTCLGGAYFPWLCAGVGHNPWGWTVWCEDHDWGVVTADLLPKPEFWAMRTLFSPVWFPSRVPWKPGQTDIRFPVTNQYNAIDLAECTIRTQMHWGTGPGGHRWQDIPCACPPGETRELVIPLWNPATLEALGKGIITICRITLLDPHGFRPLTTDLMMVPDHAKEEDKRALAIGPDAIM